MNRLLLLLLLPFCNLCMAQNVDTLLYDRFETGGASFTLNSADQGGVSAATGYNQWIINNAYQGGNGSLVCLGFPFTFTIANTPVQPAGITGGTNTNYMHIVSDAAQASNIDNSNFLAADGLCYLNENNFSRMAADVNTIGYDSVTVSFLWHCAGGTNIYGEFYYSTNSGTSWTVITTPVSQYKNQNTWAQQSITLPAFVGNATLRYGFRFVNQSSTAANDPGFGIDEFLITAKTAGPPLAAAFGVSDPELCASGCVDFNDLSTGTPTSWLWIFQGASTGFSTQQNPLQICYTSPGTYQVTLIVGNASGTDTLTLNSVIVHPNPPQPALTLSGDTLYATPGFAMYQWSLDGMIIPGAINDFHPVLSDGAYTVSVTDSNGCSSESLPLNFTTSLWESFATHLNIYPNPARDLLNIEHPIGANRIIIYDVLGKIADEYYLNNHLFTSINISKYSPGVYRIRLFTEKNETAVSKFVKL